MQSVVCTGCAWICGNVESLPSTLFFTRKVSSVIHVASLNPVNFVSTLEFEDKVVTAPHISLL